uniref:Uncharacterized protein n=1 Tax=Chinchilla lanigera TaxID=34839 RepID=A0A8C2VVI8_CHILA
MKPATALVLLGAALVLISGANGELCETVKKDVHLFLFGSPKEYVTYVGKYNQNLAVLENAKLLKACLDSKLTGEDKENASSALEKIYSSPYC